MRAVVISEYGGTDVLKVVERDAPTVGPTQIQVEVKAVGVNFADVMSRLGQYPHCPEPPCVTAYEFAGVVTDVGADAKRFSVGDRVAGVTREGAAAELVSIEEDDAIAIPDRFSFVEGAAVPITYATAYAALVTYGNLQAGERVLIHAAAGGVGASATQLAKNIGGYVVGTASPAKHDAIRRNGVDEALDYTKPGWDEGIEPFDLVIDAIGGDSFKRSYDLLRAGGRLVPYGAVSLFSGGARDHEANEEEGDFRIVGGLDVLNLMIDSKAVLGFDIRVLWDDRGTMRQWLEPLEPLMESGVIAPLIADEVPFEETARGHQMLSDRQNVGKVVLVP